jgi:hypothetical protein
MALSGVQHVCGQDNLDAWLGQAHDVCSSAAANAVQGRRALAPTRRDRAHACSEQFGVIRSRTVQVELCATTHVACAAADDRVARVRGTAGRLVQGGAGASSAWARCRARVMLPCEQ